jgi:hypothetical protein
VCQPCFKPIVSCYRAAMQSCVNLPQCNMCPVSGDMCLATSHSSVLPILLLFFKCTWLVRMSLFCFFKAYKEGRQYDCCARLWCINVACCTGYSCLHGSCRLFLQISTWVVRSVFVHARVQRFNNIEPDGAKELDVVLEKMTNMKVLYLVSFDRDKKARIIHHSCCGGFLLPVL